jgi:hypothetical protein
MKIPRSTFAMLFVLIVAACTSGGDPASGSRAAPPAGAGSTIGAGSPDEPVTAPPNLVDLFPPIGDGAQLTIPRPGQLNARDLGATAIEPRVEGRRLIVRLTWYSGVEPCNVLDSVEVAQRGFAYTLTIREGSGAGDVACIDIAVLKATLVDLGELEPGVYTIAAGGEAAPVTVTIE